MPRKTQAQVVLRTAFTASVWLSILFGTVLAVRNVWNAEALFVTWGPFAARVFLAPFTLAAGQLFWWFGVYRPHGLEGRPVMIMMGIFFFIVLLVFRLNESMHGLAPGAFTYLFFLFVAAAHLGYGIFGRG